MNSRTWMAMVALAGLLAGCGGQKAYNLELRNAHGALQAGFPELAETHLGKAGKIAADRKLPPDGRAMLLLAEARLQNDEPDTARALAQQVAETHVPGTRRRAQAEEVIAKADIRQGRFGEAREHLIEADRSYTAEPDHRRVADLLHLVRGLEAYARGQTTEARQHWRAIDDAELKLSISMNTNEN